MSADDCRLHQQVKLTQAQAWKRFQACFLELIKPSHPEGITIYAFISRILSQFHLTSLYDPAYVLHETYLRAFDYICGNKNGRIHSPTPWIKATAVNVVRELSRRERKTDSTEDVKGWEQLEAQPSATDFNVSHEITLIMLAFQRLPVEDQRILRLVLMEDRPYREIQQMYGSEGDDISEATLRKKKERALKRLRDIYHAMADQDDCSADC